MHLRFPILLLVTLVVGCQPSAPPADLVLRGGTIVDVVTGETAENQDIWILQKLAELAAKSERVTPRVIAIEDGIKSGDLDAARSAFDALRAEDPAEISFSQYTPFFIGFAYLYGDEGYSSDPQRLRAALMLYEMYAETYPDYHSAHYMLALAREANGDEKGAIAGLRRALEIHPTYPNAREKLAALQP